MGCDALVAGFAGFDDAAGIAALTGWHARVVRLRAPNDREGQASTDSFAVWEHGHHPRPRLHEVASAAWGEVADLMSTAPTDPRHDLPEIFGRRAGEEAAGRLWHGHGRELRRRRKKRMVVAAVS